MGPFLTEEMSRILVRRLTNIVRAARYYPASILDEEKAVRGALSPYVIRIPERPNIWIMDDPVT